MQLILNLLQLTFQSGNTQTDCPAADECVVHPLSPHGTGHIALIKHAVRRKGNLEIAQLLDPVAAHHTPQ